MGFEFDGRLYAFSYEDGPLVELDEVGNMIRIITDSDEYNEVLNAMREGDDDGTEL